jgi:hypothetical protein
LILKIILFSKKIGMIGISFCSESAEKSVECAGTKAGNKGYGCAWILNDALVDGISHKRKKNWRIFFFYFRRYGSQEGKKAYVFFSFILDGMGRRKEKILTYFFLLF